MKHMIKFVLLALLIISCEKEEGIVNDMKIRADQITKLELRADHKTLLPNGKAIMGFNVIVYATKDVTAYITNDDDTQSTVTTKEEFIVPNDQVPEGVVKIYEESGQELKNNNYSTTTDAPGAIKKFYASTGNLKSDNISVTIRPLPQEPAEELVIPVVFHLISLPATGGPAYDVSTEYLTQQLEMISNTFNGKITTDPNGGNAKIVFKLAEYNNKGIKMQTKGKTSYTLNKAEAKTVTDVASGDARTNAYKAIILKKKETMMYDPNRYLNVWLIKFSDKTAVKDSYIYTAPSIMHTAYDYSTIPGIEFKSSADTFSLDNVTDCLQVGIIVNFTPFFNPSVQGSNEFNFATPIAGYYGLLNTECLKYANLNPDGDNDYCADTYNYFSTFYTSVYKANNLKDQPEISPDRPMEYFTSFNVMDVYSRKTSVSVDQAQRMRKVLEQCPERYAYKSKFAFTGK